MQFVCGIPCLSFPMFHSHHSPFRIHLLTVSCFCLCPNFLLSPKAQSPVSLCKIIRCMQAPPLISRSSVDHLNISYFTFMIACKPHVVWKCGNFGSSGLDDSREALKSNLYTGTVAHARPGAGCSPNDTPPNAQLGHTRRMKAPTVQDEGVAASRVAEKAAIRAVLTELTRQFLGQLSFFNS